MIIYDDEYVNCSQEKRDKFLDKLFFFLFEMSETWSEEDMLSMEYEFHEILSELLYKYLCFINDGASDDVKKVDKPNFSRCFSLFCNSFLDDEFRINVYPDTHICHFSSDGVCPVCRKTLHIDPDAHSCDYSTDGVCSICGDIKYHSRAWFDIFGGEYSDTDYPY